MLKTRATSSHDTEPIIDFAEELFDRSTRARTPARHEATRDALRAQAAKRVAIRFEVVETVDLGPLEAGRRLLRGASSVESADYPAATPSRLRAAPSIRWNGWRT